MVAPAASEASSLRVSGVRKTFPLPDDPTTRRSALEDISLSLAAGELVSLVGPSGCGKSTLLRLIAGLDSPDSGELMVGAEPITGPNAERGLVFQDPNLFPWLTVRRNIEAGWWRGTSSRKSGMGGRIHAARRLESFADAHPHLFPGMAQRGSPGR